MPDKTLSVSLFPLLSSLTWFTTIALMMYGLYTDRVEFSYIGLAMSAAAATLNIRCFCGKLSANITGAFELGKEAGRAEVRHLTSR